MYMDPKCGSMCLALANHINKSISPGLSLEISPIVLLIVMIY